eukprot:10507871-Lingulodinium_polyedra.AAC.1
MRCWRRRWASLLRARARARAAVVRAVASVGSAPVLPTRPSTSRRPLPCPRIATPFPTIPLF